MYDDGVGFTKRIFGFGVPLHGHERLGIGLKDDAPSEETGGKNFSRGDRCPAQYQFRFIELSLLDEQAARLLMAGSVFGCSSPSNWRLTSYPSRYKGSASARRSVCM